MTVPTPDSYGAIVKRHMGYHPTYLSDSFLATLPQSFTPGTSGDMAMDEGGTGGRPEIGECAFGAQIWSVTRDARARGYMLAQADLSKQSWPYHQRVQGQTDAGPPRPWRLSVDHYGDILYDGAVITIIVDPNVQYGINYDTAHSPQFVFDAAMLMGFEGNETKFREYLVEMQYRVMYVLINTPGNYTQGPKGICYSGQQRGMAWMLRDVSDLLLLLEYIPTFGFTMTSDDSQWLTSVSYMVQENGNYFNGVFNVGAYVTDIPQNSPGSFEPYAGFPTGFKRNIFGCTQLGNPGGYSNGDEAIIAPWQQGFHSHIIMRTARRRHTSLSTQAQQTWDDLAQYCGKWPVTIFGPFANDPTTLDTRRADKYTFIVGGLSTGFFPTIAAMKAANFDGTTALPLADSARDLMAHDSENIQGFPGGFTNNVTPALADAVMLNVPGASDAWTRLTQLNQYQQGSDLAFANTVDGVYWPNDVTTSGGTAAPTPAPATAAPTRPPALTAAPTSAPTLASTSAPTTAPTSAPTNSSTTAPSVAQVFAVMRALNGSRYFDTAAHYAAPASTTAPTPGPTSAPTGGPTSTPTSVPTGVSFPTSAPTLAPTTGPTPAPSGPIEVIPVPNTQLRSQYGAPFILIGANAMDGLSTSAIAYVGRIVNVDNELDFAVQVYAPTIAALGLKALSVFVGAGPDINHMPEGLDVGNLVKIGEVGMSGGGGWSAMLSIAKTLNLMPPVVDIYVRNDCGRPLAPSGHQAIVLPTSARWIAA